MARTYPNARMVALELQLENQLENALIGAPKRKRIEDSDLGPVHYGPPYRREHPETAEESQARRRNEYRRNEGPGYERKLARNKIRAPNNNNNNWTGRSIMMQDFKVILENVVEEMKSMTTPRGGYDFLDVGCGKGEMLREVATSSDHGGLFKNLCGIEIDTEMANEAKRKVPRAKILTNDINDSATPAAVRKVLKNPTFAYVYDGGLFPINTLKNAINMLSAELRPGSVIVFVTNFGAEIRTGKQGLVYEAQDIVDMVHGGNRFELFMDFPAREQGAERGTEATMKAIFFKEKRTRF